MNLETRQREAETLIENYHNSSGEEIKAKVAATISLIMAVVSTWGVFKAYSEDDGIYVVGALLGWALLLPVGSINFVTKQQKDAVNNFCSLIKEPLVEVGTVLLVENPEIKFDKHKDRVVVTELYDNHIALEGKSGEWKEITVWDIFNKKYKFLRNQIDSDSKVL